MEVKEIVKEAARHGIHLYVRGDELAYRAKPGALDARLKTVLRDNKKSIIDYLRQKRNGAVTGASGAGDIPKATGEARSSLSFPQRRLWFINQLEDRETQYNIVGALSLEGELNGSALKKAISTIVERHQILRTNYVSDQGEPVAVVTDRCSIAVFECDLSGLGETERGNEIARQIRKEQAHAFDLTSELLIRVHLLATSVDKHVLLFNMHHIVSDGWSAGIFVNELSELYSAYASGLENPLPELQIQYADYCSWQRDRLRSQNLEAQLEYWEENLRNIPQLHNLPLDRQRPPEQSFSGQLYEQHLDEQLSMEIQRKCRQEGITLYILLETIFSILVARYSNERDVVLGTPIAGRLHEDLSGLIGLFVNTLVIRTRVEESLTFKELLGINLQTILTAYENQEAPFDVLVERLHPNRTLSHNPIVQIIFVVQNNDMGEIKLDGLRVKNYNSEVRQLRFDLEVNVLEDGADLVINWYFNDDIFDLSSIRRMASNFKTLIESVLESPDENVYRLKMLNDAEEEEILSRYENITAKSVEEESTLASIFEDTASRYPHNVAVSDGMKQIVYSQLNHAANTLARYLIDKGICSNTLVGICMDKGTGILVSILALLKTGCAYVPLDPRYPDARIKHIIDDSCLLWVLTDIGHKNKEPLTPVSIICVEEILQSDQLGRYSPENLSADESGVTGSSPAYLIYTSGTSGSPKGVLVEHQQVVRLLRSSEKVYQFGETDCWTMFHSVAFDFSVWEIWGALAYGGRLLVVSPETAVSTDDFYDLLLKNNVTVLNQTPSAFYQLIRVAVGKAELPFLRYVILGGEELDPSALRLWYEKYGDRGPVLVNMYGITETTVHVTHCTLRPGGQPNPKSIGLPLADLKVRVCDAVQHRQPIGVPGELLVGGPGLSRGYLQQPRLTASRFVHLTTPDGNLERYYRSGDLVRYRESGELEYLGRMDRQVKLRGYRIELAEIEARISQFPPVSNCRVFMRGSTKEQESLVAYICPSSSAVEAAATSLDEGRIGEWVNIFDDTYSEGEAVADETLNTSGWISSYNDAPIPQEQMDEWVNNTVNHIVNLNPSVVLEVGCGTGMLLYRYAQFCRHVCAVDISERALQLVSSGIKVRGWNHVDLYHGDIGALSKLEGIRFNTVILNSVVQYFPSAKYLVNTINYVLSILHDGGCIFVGDVRNLDLLKAFASSVLFEREKGTPSIGEFREKVVNEIAAEEELILSPAFFYDLEKSCEEIGKVDIYVKRGKHSNEMTKFRYDVVITKGKKAARSTSVEWIGWDEKTELGALLRQLEPGAILGVSDIPNKRVQDEITLLRLIESAPPTCLLKESTDVKRRGGYATEAEQGPVDIEDIYRHAESSGCKVAVTWSSGSEGCIDAIFSRGDKLPAVVSREPYEKGNVHNYPELHSLGKDLLPAVKKYLSEYLPNFMVPAAYVLVPGFPVTENGKVDLSLLPSPQIQSDSVYVKPSTPLETQLQEIWGGVLSRADIGVNVSFFDMGGHSLLAARLVGEIRAKLKRDVNVRGLFEHPTIAEFAAYAERQVEIASRPPIRALGAAGGKQLSYAQQRLWFIDQYEKNSAHYNIQGVVKISGDFDAEIARKALHEIVRRHEVLRTNFVNKNGNPVLARREIDSYPLECVDCSMLAGEEEHLQVNEILERDLLKPFSLEKDLMLRATFISTGRNSTGSEGILILNMPHIASDGWSVGVLLEEFAKLYRAYNEGGEYPLKPLAIQYSDFAAWQRNWFAENGISGQITYWENQLRDLPEVHSLPVDRPRPKEQKFEGEAISFSITDVVYKELNELAIRTSSTLFIVLHAILSLVIYRFSNSQDVVIGSPIANRVDEGLHNLIGYFANTLVLRTRCDPHTAFIEHLLKVRDVNLAAQDNQDVPFEMIVERIQPTRCPSHSPLFQIAFAMDTTSKQIPEIKGIAIEPLSKDRLITTFDLTLLGIRKESRVDFRLEYSTAIFDRGTVERIASAISEVARNINSNVDRHLIDIPILPKEEVMNIQMLANDTSDVQLLKDAQSTQSCLHEMFISSVKRWPLNIAVHDAEGSLTYTELFCLSKEIAKEIEDIAGDRELIIAIRLPRGRAQIASAIAVMMIGGAYLPMETEWPIERCISVAKQANASAVISSLNREEFERAGLGFFTPDLQKPVTEDNVGQELNAHTPSVSSDRLAYVIFTSGSTGKPKGVAIEHKAAANTILDINKRFGVGKTDKVLSVSALSFDLSVYDIFGLLAAGGSIVCVDDDHSKDPSHWRRLVDEYGITIWNSVPVSAQALAEQYEIGPENTNHSLRCIMMSGDWIPPELPSLLLKHFESASIYSLGGATEASIWSIVYPIKEDTRGLKSVPYGKPLSNQRFYILNDAMQHCPVGVEGQLYIGGAGLARCYLNDEKRTLESFVWCQPLKERLYRTGDLGRYLPTGDIQFIGRVDRQVKLRGYRIEPEEIEVVLKQETGVKEAVVVIQNSAGRGQHLIAYVVSHDALTGEEKGRFHAYLKQALRDRLPAYMVPDAIVSLKQLPLNANGKVDRNALPEQDIGVHGEGYTPPSTDTEKRLASIWAKLLKIDEAAISSTANFFELGGHSLLAVKVVAEIRDGLAKSISLKELFEHSEIANLAEYLDNSKADHLSTPLPIAKERLSWPLTSAQQSIWLSEKMNGAGNRFNMPLAFRVTGEFDVHVAERAIQAITERHAILKTTIEETPQGPRQVVRNDRNFKFQFHDCSEFSEVEKANKCEKFIYEHANEPFELKTELPLRGLYILTKRNGSDSEGILLFNVHHIVSDEWSLGVLVKEFEAHYQTIMQGLENSSDVPVNQFADFAWWYDAWTQGDEANAQLRYWTEALSDASLAHGLVEHRAAANVSRRGAIFVSELSSAAKGGLKDLARIKSITPLMIIHAALSIVLARHSGGNKIAIGMPVTSRSESELQSLIGLFVNTVVLNVDTNHENIHDYLEHIKDIYFKARENQDISFESVKAECRTLGNESVSSGIQILLRQEDHEIEGVRIPRATVEPIDTGQVIAKLDLEIGVLTAGDGVRIKWMYDTDLFRESRIEVFHAHLDAVVNQMLKLPQGAMHDLEMLSQEERAVLLSCSGGISGGRAGLDRIEARFAVQVNAAPDSHAVIHGEDILTYRQLDRESTKLAGYLQGRGIGRNEIVAIYLPRSCSMYISILAVIKAGGAYLPLDPVYPEKRIKYILEDAAVSAILTDSALGNTLDNSSLEVIAVDDPDVRERIEEHAHTGISQNLERSINDLAYVIYTSGTTGTPKGVMVEHEGVMNMFLEQQRTFAVTGHSRVLQFASPCFDAAVSEWMMALLKGAVLCVCPDEARRSPQDLEAYLLTERITHATIPPALLAHLNPKLPYSLDCLILAGESVDEELAKAWMRKYKVFNAYGPTEASVCASMVQLKPNHPISIGRPIKNTRFLILNSAKRLTPYGATGELYIGGMGLARGYLNRQYLTGARFGQDFDFDGRAMRLYATGDLARYLENGEVQFVGRVDEQVKIRGFRVEPAEVERVLNQHDRVQTCVAVAWGRPRDTRLYAYVVSKTNAAEGGTALVSELYRYAGEFLPEYMIPASIILIDEVPLTVNGKIDKGALKGIAGSYGEIEAYRAEDLAASEVLRIAARVLEADVKSMHPTHNFFEIGGHSLLAVTFAQELSSDLKIDISVADIFECRSLEELVNKVREELDKHTSYQNDLLSSIREMSDYEVEAILNEMESDLPPSLK